MNISILLPYKENYCKEAAGAVSLFVKDTSNVSLFRKNITIFGSTKSRNYLSKNYQNLNPKKKFLQSSNREYVKSYLKDKHAENTEILEIHNRPNYIKQIKQQCHTPDAFQSTSSKFFRVAIIVIIRVIILVIIRVIILCPALGAPLWQLPCPALT